MKSVNITIAFVLFLFSTTLMKAQEIIKDSVVAPVKKVQSAGDKKLTVLLLQLEIILF